MSNTDYLLEHYRKLAGVSEEQMQKDIEEQRVKNPVPQLQEENEQLKKRVEASESALLDLMDILMGGF